MNIVWFSWKDKDHPQAGGAETVNEELAARAAAAGHSVTFLVSGFPGCEASTTRQGFKIIRTGSRLTNYVTAASYYRSHRAQLAADIVIDECNTLPYFAGLYARTRTILFFHMLCRDIWFYELPPALGVFGYLLEPLYLRLLGPKDTVITVSASTAKDLTRVGFARKNIHVISEGIDITPIQDIQQLEKFKAVTLLSHGGIRPMKRTLDQVKAFELAKDELPELSLIVSGDASSAYGQKVLNYIKRSRYANSIHYAGRTTEQEKIILMQKCHLLMVTSVKEGWGLAVTEAASQGTPSVVYDVDGLRDSVRSGITGLTTRSNTPQGMADSILEILSSPKLYHDMRTAGWQWSKTMTFDRAYADFIKVLQLK